MTHNLFFRFKTTSWIFTFLAVVTLAVAGPTGKVSGRVTDAVTGEPLPGVNVMLVGTSLGAATELDGSYYILNVPPGFHTLRFLFIGYQEMRVENIMVNIDRTTHQDISMSFAVLEAGEVVVVTAEAPIVEADKTESSVHLQARDLEALPVEGLRNVMEMTPGVNRNADGTMSIRGGGAYEINYSINGIKSMTTNTGVPAYGTGTKSDNSWKMDVNPLAIAQMEIISGGFNAEYGNAQSGVVKVVSKEGGSEFSGGFRMEYRPPGQYHWGDYVYSQAQPEWEKWGDVNQWYHAEQFLNDSTGFVDSSLAAANYALFVKTHTPDEDNVLGAYDYRKSPATRYQFSFGGPLGLDAQKLSFFLAGEVKSKPTRLPTREQIQRLNNFSLVLAWHPSAKHHFKATGMVQTYYSGMGSGSEDIRWSGLWGSYGAKRKYTLIYDSPREETVTAQNLTYKYVVSSKSFYELAVTHQTEVLYALQTPTPATDVDKRLPMDERQLEDPGPWFEKYRTYYTWSSIYNQASLTDYLELKGSFSSQITSTNLIKAGFEAWIMDQDYNASSSLSVSAFIWRTGFATNYKAKTWYASGYVQDKLEFGGMVANIGMRYDSYNFGVDVPADPHNLFYPAMGSAAVGLPEYEPSKTHTSVSPRIGVSFPIAERTAFRVQYGHFRSMPIINRALDNQTYNGWGSYGNPNLEPKLSINYEVGVQQNLWDTHQLDVVTYYNDLSNQVSTVYIEASTGSQSKTGDTKGTYTSYINNGYGHSRGVEISLVKRAPGPWHYRLSYTMSQTNYGYHGTYMDKVEMNDVLEQKFAYSASDFLAPEDRTHRFNSSVSYTFPEDWGPKLGSYDLLGNVSVGLLYRVASGLSYYWSDAFQFDYTVEANRRYPLESSTDLNIEKPVKFAGYNVLFSFKVRNLFDNQHLTPITDSAELNRWVLRSSTYADADNDATRDVYLYNYFQSFKNLPREIFFTLGVTF